MYETLVRQVRTNLIYPEIDDTAWKKEELLKEMYYVYMTKYKYYSLFLLL